MKSIVLDKEVNYWGNQTLYSLDTWKTLRQNDIKHRVDRKKLLIQVNFQAEAYHVLSGIDERNKWRMKMKQKSQKNTIQYKQKNNGSKIKILNRQIIYKYLYTRVIHQVTIQMFRFFNYSLNLYHLFRDISWQAWDKLRSAVWLFDINTVCSSWQVH